MSLDPLLLARAQFGLNIAFHILFPTITIALGWFLLYLRIRANQRHFSARMFEFFEHYLKDAPKPEWMEKGIAFIDREDEKERFGKPQAVGADAVKP